MIGSLPDFTIPPKRIVSLVPPVTESIVELGGLYKIVGKTDHCVYPIGSLSNIPSVGDPDSIDVDKIISLRPDLIITSIDQTSSQEIFTLQSADIVVWGVMPATVRETIELLWGIVEIIQCEIGSKKVHFLEQSLELAEASAADIPMRRYFCPIRKIDTHGQILWKTFSCDSYPVDLLKLLGYWPVSLKGDKDETTFTSEEIIALNPDVLLLPLDPFTPDNLRLEDCFNFFNETTAVKKRRIVKVDKTLLTWSGTRLGMALAQLPSLLLD